jgi:hypothetical protein
MTRKHQLGKQRTKSAMFCSLLLGVEPSAAFPDQSLHFQIDKSGIESMNKSTCRRCVNGEFDGVYSGTSAQVVAACDAFETAATQMLRAVYRF